MIASQDRREFKFLLSTHDAEDFREFVSRNIPADRGSEGGYPVISEYFDTPDRHSYWQKIWGSKNRRRVRARVYGSANGSIPPAGFIEIKHKSGAVGVKRRATLPIESLSELSMGNIPGCLLESGRPKAVQNLVAELRDLVVADGARPVVQMRYDRLAYDSGPEGTIRVTFDSGLRCRFDLKALAADDSDFPLHVLDEDSAVVEIKTIGPVPTWLRHAAGKHQLQARSMSKYCRALERFDPAVSKYPLSSSGFST